MNVLCVDKIRAILSRRLYEINSKTRPDLTALTQNKWPSSFPRINQPKSPLPISSEAQKSS